MKPQAIHVHIAQLVLRGLPGRDRYAIAAGLEQGLARAIASAVPGVLARDGAQERVDGGPVALDAATRGRAVGERVARAVYGGLTR